MPGSVGLDLSSASHTVLTPEMGIQIIKTGVHSPLPPGTCGLILGRGSSGLRGLTVIPGVLDSDYMGEIKILIKTKNVIVPIALGDRLAQLVLILLAAGQISPMPAPPIVLALQPPIGSRPSPTKSQP
ncbi:uncharacterized protein LOC108490866 [Nannospalax galili]|uniref:uncharacterized protein LOC108490866 n=1 Tax=Nannospalax galili TaxID=1026970 RepID=UPI00081A0F02|nr:uncharacterized protein LOC108490866 [Nannospalax galili]